MRLTGKSSTLAGSSPAPVTIALTRGGGIGRRAPQGVGACKYQPFLAASAQAGGGCSPTESQVLGDGGSNPPGRAIHITYTALVQPGSTPNLRSEAARLVCTDAGGGLSLRDSHHLTIAPAWQASHAGAPQTYGLGTSPSTPTPRLVCGATMTDEWKTRGLVHGAHGHKHRNHSPSPSSSCRAVWPRAVPRFGATALVVQQPGHHPVKVEDGGANPPERANFN